MKSGRKKECFDNSIFESITFFLLPGYFQTHPVEGTANLSDSRGEATLQDFVTCVNLNMDLDKLNTAWQA